MLVDNWANERIGCSNFFVLLLLFWKRVITGKRSREEEKEEEKTKVSFPLPLHPPGPPTWSKKPLARLKWGEGYVAKMPPVQRASLGSSRVALTRQVPLTAVLLASSPSKFRMASIGQFYNY